MALPIGMLPGPKKKKKLCLEPSGQSGYKPPLGLKTLYIARKFWNRSSFLPPIYILNSQINSNGNAVVV